MNNGVNRWLVVLLAAGLWLVPTAGWAQTATIAGVIRDTTGAVLPGVTVEASSPALIEKTRTAVSDGDGQFKVVDLRPGVYTVTFTLTGFNTVRREGIDLPAGFTATVNADLRVGALEETITVSGQASTVDVQNTRQQTNIQREVMDAIPAAKSAQSFAALVPGVIYVGNGGSDVGGNMADRLPSLRAHGSRSIEMPLLYDGMRFNNMNATPGGGHVMWSMNTGAVQEYTVQLGALSAEAEVSGVWQNAIPKAGGNSTHATVFGDFTGKPLMSTSNVSDERRAAWNKTIFDVNPSIGGPLKKDKLWYWASYRYWGTWEHPAGAYADSDPLDFAYTPDYSKPGYNEVWAQSEDLRLTWQATPRNKFSIWADNLQRCWCHWLLSSTRAAEATTVMKSYPNLVGQVTWNSPVTNKLLIDAGYTIHPESWSSWAQPDLPPGIFPAIEQSTGVSFRAGGGILANGFYTQHRSMNWNGKFNLTYVTGSHAFKVDFMEMHGWRTIDNMLGDLPPAVLNFNRGTPVSLTQVTYPYSTLANVGAYDGVFVQDQWTIRRITMNLGLRWDYLNSSVPAQTYPATALVPRDRSFGEIEDAPNWNDINPRFGLAYDLFGTGKTAVKANVGRFVQAVTTAYADEINPIVSSVNATTRSWNNASGTFDPRNDCDLTNPAANGGCGPMANPTFGTGALVTRYDQDFLQGWGKRPYDWEVQGAVQHEFREGLSASVTYTRHWWGNFIVRDNLAVSPSDYSPYCVTAPVDPRLPNGGGYQVCGAYDINPNKFGQNDFFYTFAKNYGDQTDVFNGVDVSVNARLRRGIIIQGGFSTSHEVFDNCDVIGKVDQPTGGPVDLTKGGLGTPLLTAVAGMASPSTLNCHVAPPFQSQVKLLGSYPLPWGMAASATYQSVPGAQITATGVFTNAQIAPSLGRNLSGNVATANVQLIAPGTMYGDRLHQVDFRLTKAIQVGAAKLQGQFNIYNLLNAGPILGLNTTYGANWLAPTATLVGRMFKFGAQLDW